MGCTLCKQLAGHNVGALDVSNYENLNPYLMKKSARQFRTHMSKILVKMNYGAVQESYDHLVPVYKMKLMVHVYYQDQTM